MTDITLEPRPIITEDGNIEFHARGGFSIRYAPTDENGDPIDIHLDALYFEIKGVLRVALESGLTDYQRYINVDRDSLSQMPLDKAMDFALIDEAADPEIVIWSGTCTMYGFREQPA